MKKSILLFAFTVLISTLTFAQKDETIFNRNGIRLTGAWGGSVNNFSNIGEDGAFFSGGYGGIEINKNLFVGFGGNVLVNDPRIGQFSNDRVDMEYGGFILGYGVNSHKVLHPQFMVMAGAGNVQVENGIEEDIFVLQPSAGLEMNVFRWMRVGAHVGYRGVFDSDLSVASNDELSNLYGEVRLKFGWSWGR